MWKMLTVAVLGLTLMGCTKEFAARWEYYRQRQEYAKALERASSVTTSCKTTCLFDYCTQRCTTY